MDKLKENYELTAQQKSALLSLYNRQVEYVCPFTKKPDPAMFFGVKWDVPLDELYGKYPSLIDRDKRHARSYRGIYSVYRLTAEGLSLAKEIMPR